MHDGLVLLGGVALGSIATLFVIQLRSSSPGKRATPPIKPAPSKPVPKPPPSPPLEPPPDSRYSPTAAASAATDLSDDQIEVKAGKFSFKGRAKFALLAFVALLLAILFRSKLPELFISEPPEASPTPPVTVIIYNDMKDGRDTRQYRIEPVANREIVSGLVGSYYYIDLKDATSQKSLFFGPEEYRKNEFSSDFRDAMAAVRKDVLRYVHHEEIPYQLFVRGSADFTGNDAAYLAELAEGESKTITYLPSVPGNPNKYSQQSTTQSVPKRYRNSDLPNLRADYVREKLAALGYSAQILQGSVTDSDREEDRYAVILLYVDWPKVITDTSAR